MSTDVWSNRMSLLTSDNDFIKLYLFHWNKMSLEENQFVNIIQLNELKMYPYCSLENKYILKTIIIDTPCL